MRWHSLSKIKISIGLLLIACSGMLHAASEDILLKLFSSDSLMEITSEKSDQPFMVVLWSIDCPPCMKELALFRDFKKQLSHDNIVFISTDGAESLSVIKQTLADHQLGKLDNWVFSGEMVERIRYAIDPEWYGELPRTYFYGSEGNRDAHSGILTKKLLSQWLQYAESLPKTESK